MILDNIAPGCCLPIRIGDSPNSSGSRIGGARPEGVSSKLVEADYLLTLVLEDDGSAEVSLFLNRDWWDFSFDQLRVLLNENDKWIDIVVHGASARNTDDQHRHLLSPCSLSCGSAVLDQQGHEDESDEVIPLSDHKMGGRPYFIKSETGFVSAVEEIERDGYRQLLQLDFPGNRDASIAGDWPFADGTFNLFFKQEGAKYHWYYCWQF